MNGIIVSADDFGASEEANRRILKLLKMNKVNRVSVMPFGIIRPEDVECLSTSGVKIDLHLTAMRYRTHKLRRGLVGRSTLFILRCVAGKMGVSSLETEWTRQLSRFRELFGRNPDGINSHEYIHYVPSMFGCAVKLAERHKIGYIRYGSRGIYKGRVRVRVSGIIRLLHWLNRKTFTAADLDSSGYMVSLDWMGPGKMPDAGAGHSIELVTHPEREDEFEIVRRLPPG